MKKFASVLIAAFLLFALLTPAFAAAESTSLRYAPSASMKEYHALFAEAEKSGGGAGLTRGMAAGILAAMSGEDLGGSTLSLADVPADAWYAPAAEWAVKCGLMLPELGCFSPDNTLHREELALMLKTFMTKFGWVMPEINERIPYNDGGIFTTSAMLDAASYLQMRGVMLPNEEALFLPDHTVTVSEAEEVFLRILSASKPLFPGLPVSSVAESEAVDASWMDDACFIGHSQVVGMSKYFKFPTADYYAVIGHTAQAVTEFEFYQAPDGHYGTLDNCLHRAEGAYGKVYIMLGINDCRNSADRAERFMKPMRQILDLVKETQPDAKIYLLSLVPVGRETPNNECFNPDNVIAYSQMVKTLSREYDAEYIDLFRPLADSEGYYLDTVNAGDGIHIRSDAYPMIADYLLRHTA